MIPTVQLNNGVSMPALGYGVFQVPPAQTAQCVRQAIAAGYRSIDTAKAYDNETEVGEGVRQSGVRREDLFITSKLWNRDQGYDSALRAFDATMARLQMDYLDLYLIHWPIPICGFYVDTWKALEKLYADGRIRAIGVSNFTIDHLETLKKECSVIPAVNQIELHPWLTQNEICDYMRGAGIAAEAWSPLAKGTLLSEPVLQQIAQKHGKTAAQVILRWDVQRNVITIPRTVKPARMAENKDVFDFALSEDDMQAVSALHRSHRTGPDPDTFTMDAPC